MCSKYSMSIAFVLAKLMLVITVFSVRCSHSAEAESTSAFSSSRHRRAPGWGKRTSEAFDVFERPNNVRTFLNDVGVFRPENIEYTEKRAPGWGKRAPGWGKRAPGWGKRAPGWGKRSYGESGFSEPSSSNDNSPYWGKEYADRAGDGEFLDVGKRAPGWGKRAPGWGKRAPGWGKRAPGWGKRSYQIEPSSDGASLIQDLTDLQNKYNIERRLFGSDEILQEYKNFGGEQKFGEFVSNDGLTLERRAPGWGKRSYPSEMNVEDIQTIKRAPGWGKRAPGWGKRNYQVKVDDDAEKRAPGWGKRNIRAKRSSEFRKPQTKTNCQELQNLKNFHLTKLKTLATQQSAQCGNTEDANNLDGPPEQVVFQDGGLVRFSKAQVQL